MSDIYIKVVDPTKQVDKFGQQFVSYKIITNTSRTGFTPGETFVIRRYNEFSWLSTELSREFPGVIVPPLPDKQSVGRFSAEFVESRRRALEKFLQRIIAHAELVTSQSVIIFLQADDATLNKVKTDKKAEKPKLATSASAWFQGTVNSISNGKAELEKSAADVKIEEISQYVIALEKLIGNASKHSDSLVKRSREISQSLSEFGQSFTWLGQSEGDSLGVALSELGTTSTFLATTAAAHAEQETIRFLEPLEEYLRMLASIKTAMTQRTDKKNAYINALTDLEAKQSAYKKLQSQPGKESQLPAKEVAIQASQEASDAAKADFERVSDRLLSEFEVFKNQKATDIKEIVLNFVNLQIEYNKQAEQAWVDLLPKIQSVVTSSDQDYNTTSTPSAPVTSNPFSDYEYDSFANQQQQQQQQYYNSNFQEDEEDLAGV